MAIVSERSDVFGVQAVDDAGLDLGGIFRLIWAKKLFIVLLMAVSTICAAYFALTSKGAYTAKMVVQTAGERGGGISSALGQLGSLVGMGGAVEDREFSQFQALMKTVVLAERLQHKYDVMPLVFPGWDAVQKRWIEPSGWRHELSVRLNDLRGRPRWTPPSIFDLAEHIETQVKVKKTTFGGSIFELTYGSGNRDFAIRFLELLHREAEALVREERKARVTEQIKYLRSRVELTAVLEYRLALIQLLSDQEKMLMLLESNMPFATIVIEPANAPMRPTGLSLTIAGFVAVVGSLVLGILLVLVHDMISRSLRRPTQS